MRTVGKSGTMAVASLTSESGDTMNMWRFSSGA